MKIVKTKAEIQRKWDMILCRYITTKIRHREAYYDIARFAIGHRFEGRRAELHRLVIELELDRMVEFTKYKGRIGKSAKNDFRDAILRHNADFIADCYAHSSPVVMMQINDYKWKDLSNEREMLKERWIEESDHTYSSKSGCGVGRCSDWLTVK